MIVKIHDDTLRFDDKTRAWVPVGQQVSVYAILLNTELFVSAVAPNPEADALREAKRFFPSLTVVEKAKIKPTKVKKGRMY